MKERLILFFIFHFCILYFTNVIKGDAPAPGIPRVPSENLSSSDSGEEKINHKEVPPSEQESGEVNAQVHSSFEEVVVNENVDTFSVHQEQTFSESASQNSGISAGITDSTHGIVFSLVDSASAEIKQKADLSSATASQEEIPSLSSNNSTEKHIEQTNEPKESDINVKLDESNHTHSSEQAETQQTDKLESDVPNAEPKSNTTDPIADTISTERSEDIPSFSEWTQKQLEEAERKKELVNNSAQGQNWNGKQNSSLKVRSKNYASPDCGAKIIAANPEATNAGAVLSSSKDEYYLNVCTNRIWFIVELCEAIQAKKIDIANFELFSSSPKDFAISVSDRFPSREWANVGQFVAKDEKDVQSFELNPHLFGKYVKVEVHSHYGSEHFCPISLFRVYGSSEIEVIEREDTVHLNIEDDYDDDTMDSEKGASPKNLFSSATDAVISIVKKAVEVMGNKGNTSNDREVKNETKTISTPLISTCTTVSHNVVCDNCSDILFGYIYQLLSCKARLINSLIAVPSIRKTIYNSQICEIFGLDFRNTDNTTPYVKSDYLKVMLPKPLLGALCNTVAVMEEKTVLNISNKFSNITKTMNLSDIEGILKVESVEPQIIGDSIKVPDEATSEEVKATEKLILDKTDKLTLSPEGITDINYNMEINPTKTLSPDDLNDTNSIPISEVGDTSRIVHATEIVSPPKLDANNVVEKPSSEQEYIESDLISENISEFETTTESAESLEEHFENIISDINDSSTTTSSSPVISKTVTSPGPKESVFLRLTNRIKALERNMSLSSQYLEELSRRYKKQVEEMQRVLDKTLISWAEDKKQRDERNKKLEEQLATLTAMVESMVADKNSWVNTTYWFFIIIVLITGILTFCRRSPDVKQIGEESASEVVQVKRRKSIDIVRHKAPVKKKRRPSEEALKISGSYQHLMVDETGNSRKKEKKRRKKKQSMIRSNSMTTLAEEGADVLDPHRTPGLETNNSITTVRSFGNLWKRQESAPAKTNFSDHELVNRVEDIPFPLDDYENSPLEPIPANPEIVKTSPSQEYTNGNLFVSNVSHLSSSGFIRTAREARLSRNSSVVLELNGHQNKVENGRSSSPDDSIIHGGSVASDDASINSVSDDKNSPKKEKRSGFKRLLRKVF